MDMMNAGRRRWPWLLQCLPLWLCWCVVPEAGASGTAPRAATEAAAISAIALERDCSGCATGTRLVLRRDGTAQLTVTGKARLGTEDRTSRGSLPVAEFDALARLVVAQGVLAMNEVYEEPGLQDGPWATLTITLNGQERSVFRRDEAGPPALRALESAVAALQARIAFAPVPR